MYGSYLPEAQILKGWERDYERICKDHMWSMGWIWGSDAEALKLFEKECEDVAHSVIDITRMDRFRLQCMYLTLVNQWRLYARANLAKGKIFKSLKPGEAKDIKKFMRMLDEEAENEIYEGTGHLSLMPREELERKTLALACLKYVDSKELVMLTSAQSRAKVLN